MEVRLVQLLKVKGGISVRLFDSVTDFKLVQPSKVLYFPKDVTLLGIVMESKAVQYWNACIPIVVTLFGISIERNDSHPLKVTALIVVILLGIST
jgi:hypothetical protein